MYGNEISYYEQVSLSFFILTEWVDHLFLFYLLNFFPYLGQSECVSLINNFLSVDDLGYYTKPQG